MSVPDPTLRFRRQLDLLPLDKLDVPVTLIGAGAVGSFTTLALAKMGFTNLTVYDDDVVDSHNLPNQMYRLGDLNRLKVDALTDLVRSFEGIEIRSIPERFDGGRLSGIVIGAVDSMASRQVIWTAVRFDPSVRVFIDARMGGLVSIVRPVRPTNAGDVRRYEASLHGDDDAVQEPCTARAILFTVLALASTIARLVRAELVGLELPREVVQDHALAIQLVT